MLTKFDVNKGCTIDETGLLVNCNGRGQGVRASTSHNKGKRYFEVKTGSTAVGCTIGLCEKDMDISMQSWTDPSSMILGLYNGAYRFAYGSNYRDVQYAPGTETNPCVAAIAIDFDEHWIACYYNGLKVIDESYTGKLTNEGTPLYPFMYTGAGDVVGWLDWNFGSKPFAYPVPEGYQPWDSNQRLYIKENAIYGMQNNA